MRGLVQNQLKSQSLNTVAPSAFKQVGGDIFPDSTANMDMAKLSAIVEAFQSVHSPNYGQPIPQTSEVSTGVGSKTLLSLDGNEVALVSAITCVNASAAPTHIQIKVGSMIIVEQIIPPTTPTQIMTGMPPLYIDSLNDLTVTIVTGEATALTTTALSMRVCQ
tara:strand:- start:552 stop:1040 length:489 start_codon:yes stop_codon:yes gene_type:complete